MPPSATFQTKVKVQLKLAIARLRLVQSRDENLSRSNRRAMAQLLDAGKAESARIRVESIIRTDIISELHEFLELYCELLHARAGLLEAAPACDPGLDEAVRSIIYAAPRTEEMKELQHLAHMLGEKFGKDFYLAAKDNSDGKVPAKIVRKLSVSPPSEELVAGYLEEIAKAYGVRWPRKKDVPQPPEDLIDVAPPDYPGDGDVLIGTGGQGDGGEDAGKNNGGKNKKTRSAIDDLLLPEGGGDDDDEKEEDEEEEDQKEIQTREELSKATPPKSFEPRNPVRAFIAPPSTDNPHPKLTFNSVEIKLGQKPADAELARKGPDIKGRSAGGGVPSLDDELAKRFAALKR